MLPINLRNLISAKRGLSDDLLNGLFEFWGVAPKPAELNSLESFIDKCDALAPQNPESVTNILGDCYFDFSIPRISKEFDCLWIGEKTVINLELKSQPIGNERIKRQLFRNRYYLSHLKRNIKSYTYEASTGRCVVLKDDRELEDISISDVASALFSIHKELLFEDNIEDLFPPERFLVSPFNSTEAFLKGHYFLTDYQQTIKKKILQFIGDPSLGCFCALTGGPGSGKTLLMYDMAKTLMDMGIDVLIGHAGGLNEGQKLLIEAGWRIKPTKNIFSNFDFETQSFGLEDAGVYMIDEAQRCYHLNQIVEEVRKKGRKCLLSYDREQVMSPGERRRDNGAMIKEIAGEYLFRLSSNIRTNAAVYEFVSALFDLSKSVNKPVNGNIAITFCQNSGQAITILSLMKQKGFHVPKFTPRLHGIEDYEAWFPGSAPSAHEVIGQEFDCVASLLSENMYYNTKGRLVSRGNYLYSEDRMLYQILSRARKKIHLVIVNNPVILNRCLTLARI